MHTFVFVLLLLLINACTPSATEELGTVNMTFTARESVQDDLLTGWLLLHSFEYDDARETFRSVREQDPYAPMAYWGEAMSHHYTLWDREETQQARAILAVWDELSADSEISMSPTEASLMEAAQILFGKGTQQERNQHYAAFMAKQYERFPDNHEIGALYALSLLGSVAEGRNYDIYGQAAVIANRILNENPQHPGALHYLIHAYDDPDHAHLALNAAFSYSTVAPDAAHALHMPSHIFVARGMWDEVVASNFASYYASVDRMERKNMNNNARSYHAFAWLMYGLLQQGRMEEARQILIDMRSYCSANPSIPARAYRVGMIATWLACTHHADSDLVQTNIPTDDLTTSLQAVQEFTKGYKAYLLAQPETIHQAVQAIEKARIIGINSLSAGAPNQCSTPQTAANPSMIDIRVAEVMQLELKALAQTLEENDTEAEFLFRAAIDKESNTDFEYGPPTIVKPAHELYADWLYSKGRYQEAIEEYTLAEQRTPRRSLVTDPKRKALNILGLSPPDDPILQPEAYEIQYISR